MGIFQDKIVIITGGASGIGRCLGQELARRGARVILADIDLQAANEAADLINKAGGQARAVKLDVSDFAAFKALVDHTVAEYGRLDYLFNNAGIGVYGEAQDLSYDDWRRVIEVDFFGVVNGVIAGYPVMVGQGYGHIVNTASLAGLVPSSHTAPYTASKHGVVGLSHVLRLEGAGLGVKVSVVCPGFVLTPILQSGPTVKYDRKKILANIRGAITPEKCALAILKGVERNKATIVVTTLAKIFYLLYRISPGLVFRVVIKFADTARREWRLET